MAQPAVGPDEEPGKRERLLAELFGAEPVPSALSDRLLRTSEVAALFQVSERTVVEWAKRGLLPSVRTPGGQRRYPASTVRELLTADGGPAAGPPQ